MPQLKSKVILNNSDGTKEPAIGAQIQLIEFDQSGNFKPLLVNGFGVGTTTDVNGNFVLNLAPELANEEIAIQYMGYQTMVLDASVINLNKEIHLEDTATDLAEITVYGTPTKKKESFPAWMIGLLIPLVFALLFLLSKFFSKAEIKKR